MRTLKSTRRELEKLGHEVDILSPLEFKTVACPTYPEIRLSLLPGARLKKRINSAMAEAAAGGKAIALHIATEGPLGIAARNFAVKNGIPFTSAYHTRFPEYVEARSRIPRAWTYRFFRWFHRPSQALLVPTKAVKDDLEAYGFSPEQVVLWSRGVDLELFKPGPAMPHDARPPVFLCVGRVAVEKNIETFLDLDLPGTKWVAGEGPLLETLRKKHPAVRFTGVLNQLELATLYNAADVFVFPSRTDTFGLVLLEAMACGCPVAAYPVTGPIDVIGDSPGAVLDEDLRSACLKALTVDRKAARAHAEKFSWEACSRQFLEYLKPVAWAEAPLEQLPLSTVKWQGNEPVPAEARSRPQPLV